MAEGNWGLRIIFQTLEFLLGSLAYRRTHFSSVTPNTSFGIKSAIFIART